MNTAQTLRRARRLATLALLGGSQVWAQQSAIYTCTDAQGRRITSDRPIAACIDRPQRDQRHAIAAQQEEQARINARFDAEAAHLKTLWAGAAPKDGEASRP